MKSKGVVVRAFSRIAQTFMDSQELAKTGAVAHALHTVFNSSHDARTYFALTSSCSMKLPLEFSVSVLSGGCVLDCFEPDSFRYTILLVALDFFRV